VLAKALQELRAPASRVAGGGVSGSVVMGVDGIAWPSASALRWSYHTLSITLCPLQTQIVVVLRTVREHAPTGNGAASSKAIARLVSACTAGNCWNQAAISTAIAAATAPPPADGPQRHGDDSSTRTTP